MILVEEGPLSTARDFRMREAEAYRTLYQESAARKTKDKSIGILQGRCVGGGTTVNWTSSFRTPETTLAYWHRTFGLEGFAADDLAPWFARVEARLGIAPWDVPPNANNEALARGAKKLGIKTAAIRRNVKELLESRLLRTRLPDQREAVDAVTTVPAALERGATLVTRARALEFAHRGDRVTALSCAAMDARGVHTTARRLSIRARAFVAAGGAIGTPALLLRSRVPDPHQHRRQAHVPASDDRFRRSHAGADRPVRRRAADDLLGPFPRRPPRWTARSATSWKRHPRIRC